MLIANVEPTLFFVYFCLVVIHFFMNKHKNRGIGCQWESFSLVKDSIEQEILINGFLLILNLNFYYNNWKKFCTLFLSKLCHTPALFPTYDYKKVIVIKKIIKIENICHEKIYSTKYLYFSHHFYCFWVNPEQIDVKDW